MARTYESRGYAPPEEVYVPSPWVFVLSAIILGAVGIGFSSFMQSDRSVIGYAAVIQWNDVCLKSIQTTVVHWPSDADRHIMVGFFEANRPIFELDIGYTTEIEPGERRQITPDQVYTHLVDNVDFKLNEPTYFKSECET